MNVVVRCLSENANSGIFVSESLSSGQVIPVRRDTVVAFLGPAPRGPVGIPISIGSVAEYLKRFGVPGCDSPLFDAMRQFFSNGGEHAIVVRICSSARCHRIVLPGPSGALSLEAINPGPHELLRASIDYDGIPSADDKRFNLVVHRLASRDHPMVEQQEIYQGLSVDVADADYVGHALVDSGLIAVKEPIPDQRPNATFCRGIEVGVSYVYVDPGWQETGCLTDYDLIGSHTEGTGLFALDHLSSIDLVCLVPGVRDPGQVAIFAAERYCRKRNAILLVDPPAHWQSSRDAIGSARRTGLTSPNIVTYFPRPIDRNRSPASILGALAGALASSDARDGVWTVQDVSLQIPAGTSLPCDLQIGERQVLKQTGINALRLAGPLHLELKGLVTLNRGSGCITEWDELRLRRTTLLILDSIARGTRWTAFQDNDIKTHAELRKQVERYLHDLYTAGATGGPNRAGAGYVIVDRQIGSTCHRNPCVSDDSTGLSFVVGFMPVGHGMQSFRFYQHPVECHIQTLHIDHPVALAS